MKATFLFLAILGCALSSTVPSRKLYPVKHAYPSNVNITDDKPSGLEIINGVEAVPHSIPYQIYMVGIANNGGRWSCGGSLITERYVLTAAHCLDGAASVQVHLGVHDLRRFETGSLEINSRSLIIHENYNSDTIDNDIGLIELDGEVYPSSTIGYARLPSRSAGQDDLVGRTGRVSGWGLTDGALQTTTFVLMQVNSTVIQNRICNLSFGVVRNEEICLTGQQGTGACRGDSGGPMVIGNLLEGVVSYGSQNCARTPSVFARVRSFLPWIETHSNWRSS